MYIYIYIYIHILIESRPPNRAAFAGDPDQRLRGPRRVGRGFTLTCSDALVYIPCRNPTC